MTLNEKYIKQIIKEELTRQEVRNIVSNKLESFVGDKEFKDKVKEVAIDVLDKFFQQMWTRKSMWKSGLKNA